MEDRCVCCGEIIPEGSGVVCKICEERILHEEKSEKPSESKRKSQGRNKVKDQRDLVRIFNKSLILAQDERWRRA